MKTPKVKTVQFGYKLIILDGISPIMYVDLIQKKLYIYPDKPKEVK